ncbi:MAG: twin transmembrane helix small protein [Tepidimonas ignava]|jgi:archaellum biogenesis protein FlaJ (TadC family)|uniref:DUF2909 family protein n=1 Tax=Tepidimonas ignava TaxID=114249 RepID=A0A4R3LCT0_9BURK|nr:twin transmembrane helix small protein [Tepidimonas ignava]MCX7814904.1 twin transmembrane helix small protein [Tepidimonas ignava]TCS97118.1 DUF2909 family protein [Tepidimonas ignava]TSE22352.1 hypothetical protein Tigna_01183 [Tepidimonas ignava]
MKAIVALAFVGILASLASALVAMMRGDSQSGDARRQRRMVRALTMRIGLSVALFVFLIIAHQLGWIQPTGLPQG